MTDTNTDRRRAEAIDAVKDRLEYPKYEDGSPNYAKGPIKKPASLEAILKYDPYFWRGLRYNKFAGIVEWQGELITDVDITAIRLAVSDTYNYVAGVAATSEMVTYTAHQHSYHPIVDYLDGLVWDGKPRINQFLTEYATGEDTPLNHELGRRFMISCVARVLRPGCKVDQVLILAGPQGVGKSTFFRALASDEWFSDSSLDIRNKDAYQSITGNWIYEMAELAAMRPRDAETVKAFLSAQEDRFRPAYGRNIVHQKRQVVFVGTTNEEEFLNDPTGARRFWPVKVSGRPRVDLVKQDRDQLWAEATEAFRGGEHWHLVGNLNYDLSRTHKEYAVTDPWSRAITQWLAVAPKPPGISWTIGEILKAAVDVEIDKQNKAQSMRLGGALVALGWTKKRAKVDGVRANRWFPPNPEQVALAP